MADERALTRRLGRWFGSSPDVLVGIGDDAAVVRSRGRAQVLCCDPVIEHVHFSPEDDPKLVGRKAVNRNLADLAAMGALGDWLLVSVILPAGWPSARCDALFTGIRAAARAADCLVVGGDVAVVDGPLVVTVTAIGHPAAGRTLQRTGARAGDTIHVTGPLGGSRTGRHLRFRPPLQEGAWLAEQRAVRSAIDVSDGLLLDLATVLEASGGLGAELRAEAIPVSAAARGLAAGDLDRARRHALEDGEDHVLLWTQATRRELSTGGPVTARARRPIGTVLAEPGLWLCARDGSRRRLEARGYQHAVPR